MASIPKIYGVLSQKILKKCFDEQLAGLINLARNRPLDFLDGQPVSAARIKYPDIK
jgi:hypothetical protein